MLQTPVITGIAHDPTGFTLTFPTETGATYAVQYKYSLDDLTWQLLTNVTGTGLPASVADYPPTNAMKLYRVELR